MALVFRRLAACLPLAIFVLPTPAKAVICKSMDENGVVSYTDTPSSECENPVKLRGYSRYTPRQIDSTSEGAAGTAGSGDGFAGYRSLRFVQPANNSTVRSNEGKVSVQVGLEPGLQQGHRIQLLLDGQPVGSPLGSADAVLSGIDRGTHQLSAQVLDGEGNVIATIAATRFTLHREILDSEEPDNGTGGDHEDVYRPDFTPSGNGEDFRPNFAPSGNGGSFTPDFAPKGGYTPQPGGFPRTPGTNPAFTPKYNP